MIPCLPDIALQHHLKTLEVPMLQWRTHLRYPPVLLLSGQSGIGKRSVAYFLAQWILCESPEGLKPCQNCASCLKTRSGNSVDILEISSIGPGEEAESSSDALKIDQFRKLKESIGYGAHEGHYKIVIIPKADRMTLQAANSVLKLLEDTPKKWLFFLTANDPSLLLPTIVSRCQTLRLKPFSQEEIAMLLRGTEIKENRQEICAKLSGGSWKRAILFGEDLIWEQRKVVFEFLQTPSSTLASLVDWASQNRENSEILLDLLEQVTAEFVGWSVSPEKYHWTQSDRKEELNSYARSMVRTQGNIQNARKFWLAQIQRIAETRESLAAPLNRKILAQNLLLPWVGIGNLKSSERSK